MKEELLVKDKDVVVPGETLARGMGYLPSNGVFRSGEELVAGRLGMISVEGKVLKLIPVSGKYSPKMHDKIICTVVDVLLTGWRMETGSPYSAVMNLKDATNDYIARGADLTQYFSLGDVVVVKVVNVTSQKLVDVTMRGPGLQKLRGGRTLTIDAQKVPRLIGKEGSMVSLIKNTTSCDIVVGQNGVVWVCGSPENEIIAVNAIRKVEAEAHLNGLTERITSFLKSAGLKPISQSVPSAANHSDGVNHEMNNTNNSNEKNSEEEGS